jgi:hypothetical protein
LYFFEIKISHLKNPGRDILRKTKFLAIARKIPYCVPFNQEKESRTLQQNYEPSQTLKRRGISKLSSGRPARFPLQQENKWNKTNQHNHNHNLQMENGLLIK